MKVRLVQSIVTVIICGLTTLTINVLLYNRRKRREKKNKQREFVLEIPSILQNPVKRISSTREDNRLTTPQLPDPNWVKVGKITHLQAHPLVSGKACVVDTCQVKLEGMYMFKNGEFINWDRSFLIYYEDSKDIVTATNFPTLNEVKLLFKDNYVILQATEMPNLCIKIRDGEFVECTYSCCEKILPIPKLICNDCGNDAAQWLSRFLWGRNSGLRLGYAINAVGCMGIYWQVILRNCLQYQKARRNKHKLSPFLDVLHSVLISPIPYDNIPTTMNLFETNETIYPNIVVLASDIPLEEKWEWIRIGNVVIRNNQAPAWSRNQMTAYMKLFGLGVNCDLYVAGHVKVGDNVYLYMPKKRKIAENEEANKIEI